MGVLYYIISYHSMSYDIKNLQGRDRPVLRLPGPQGRRPAGDQSHIHIHIHCTHILHIYIYIYIYTHKQTKQSTTE